MTGSQTHKKKMTLLQRIASYATILNLLFNALTYFGINPENGYRPINQKDPPVHTQRKTSH